MRQSTYSGQVVSWLFEMGYTHCFFLAGGNIMHLLDAARETFVCVPFTHESSAGIAAEYFCELSPDEKAFALVTAGPGLTNILTATAGAFTEGRELLVLGGQVKSSDLANGGIRQRGIQEIDGTALMAPICKETLRLTKPIPRIDFEKVVAQSFLGKPGPVFIELCLDAQGAPAVPDGLHSQPATFHQMLPLAADEEVEDVAEILRKADRPLLLLGGGLEHQAAIHLHDRIEALGLPVATTYNGSDRFNASSPVYFGRPNTWGMRWANVLAQQSDALIAVGTRLGLQQTGFNSAEFGPLARIVQVDIDGSELAKGHPDVDVPITADAADFLTRLVERLESSDWLSSCQERWATWVAFGREVRSLLPLDDQRNSRHPGHWSPYAFVEQLAEYATPWDVIIPCSSGGAFTATYQTWLPKLGQRIVSNKSLASMGYGLAGAIGAALARPDARIIHIEGDGGFAQNLQELGTVATQDLNIKTFLWVNDGYASIRMTQRSYFNDAWVGCDSSTGVGLPNWEMIFQAYGIPCLYVNPSLPLEQSIGAALESKGPTAFLISIHPDQTFFPKITSRITADGSMESNPLHLMTPDLPDEMAHAVLPYLGEP